MLSSEEANDGSGAARGGWLGQMVPKTEMPPLDRYIEIASAILLSLATLAIAWSGYQATRWGGVQANSFATAGADRVESVRASNEFFTLVSIDVQTFTAWAEAFSSENEPLESFWRERFRQEFKPAFEEWLASEPRSNRDAAATPFALESYAPATEEVSIELSESADEAGEAAREANQRGDNYVLAAVLYAMVLFFAGISTKFESRRLRVAGIAASTLVFVSAFAFMLTMPVSFGV